METSTSIANYFIKKGIDNNCPVSPMKALKLTYISYGWYIGITEGDELFTEDIQAWKFGPVIPSVYHDLKKFGNQSIDSMVTKLSGTPSAGVSANQPLPASDTEEFLNKIWDEYRDFTGLQLSTITHAENSPWYFTWNNLNGRNIDGTKIPNDVIEEHYKSKLNP